MHGGLDHDGVRLAAMSIWMGTLLTDRLKMVIASDPVKFAHLERSAETTEFTGHVIRALYNDPRVQSTMGSYWRTRSAVPGVSSWSRSAMTAE
jgi:hypothetical protein